MIVAKFGGSSVKDAQSMKNCAQIIERNSNIRLVILSATYNTTNELDFLFSSFIENGKTEHIDNLSSDIIERHRLLAFELLQSKCLSLENIFSEFELFISEWNEQTKEEEGKNRDRTLSFGERFSTTLFYEYLSKQTSLKERKLEFVKSYEYLKTDSNFGEASYQDGSLDLFFKKCFNEESLFVAQGYIGSDSNGDITTLGREGSDYSAALFAAAINATDVYIWTDVPGVFSCDPRLSSKAKVIDNLSYEQASLMARFGAKVLYPETMEPLKGKDIKLWVKSTQSPELRGTLISDRNCTEDGGYSVCIEKRVDGAILTQLGKKLRKLNFPILDKTENYTRYYIPLKDIRSVVEQILS